VARRRIPFPDRDSFSEDGRESLSLLHRDDQTVNIVLVALTDGVELEVWADGSLRRRMRYLRDTEARKHADRLSSRLLRRGFSRVLHQ
jgi:hypothetical protein